MRIALLLPLGVLCLLGVAAEKPALARRPSNPPLAVSGVVTDEYTHKPLVGAIVWINDGTQRAITGSTGRYRLDSLQYRHYTISARFIGYITERREVHAMCTVAVSDYQGHVVTPSRCTAPVETLNFYMRPDVVID